MSILLPSAFAWNDRFALVREVGAGGMGIVYEAIDRRSGARVALKALPFADPSAVSRFKHEFRSLAAILHPNLVSLYELFTEDDQWFFTMELVEGPDVLTWVRGPRGGRDDIVAEEQRLRNAMAQLAEGIAALHEVGVLHRDLKPSNVLIRPDGRLAILDFGIAIKLADAHPTAQLAGTLPYMSPEQLDGEPLTPASDWYALGVILYEALTGRLPFTGAVGRLLQAKRTRAVLPPSTLMTPVPSDLEALCLDLLEPDPSRRPVADAVLGRLGATTTGSRRRVRGAQARTYFVGREAQLARLGSALRRTAQGGNRIVLVSGRSGAGKSALLDRFLSDVRRDEQMVVLAGRCDEQESVPFKAVDPLIDALVRWLARQSPGNVRRILSPDSAVLRRLFPVLGRIDAVATAAGGQHDEPDARELRQHAFRALREILARIGEISPVVIVIDDLQWGDAESAELLSHVLGGPPFPRLLLVAAFRSEYRETSPFLRALAGELSTRHGRAASESLDVTPLTAVESRTLARHLLPASSESVIDRVATESAGNPLFIQELARYVRDHPRWTDESPSETLDLDRVLRSRIEALPPQSRELLEIIAIAGRPVRNRHWRAANPHAAQDPRALALLRYEHLLRSSGTSTDDEVELYHDRLRETIASRLDPDVRKTHHRRLAAALAGDADPETVAVHYAEAGDRERAGEHFALAAEAAAQALAFDRAAGLYERALELRIVSAPERRRMLVALGNALANAGRGLAAAEVYERAATLADDNERLDLERIAATQYATTGHIDRGRALFLRVLHGVGVDSPQSPAALTTQLLARRAWLRLRGLHFVERLERDVPPELIRRLDALWAVSTALAPVEVVRVAAIQSQALLLALRAGEPRRLALALAWEAVLTATAGHRTAARSARLLALARTLADDVDSPHANGMLHLAEGWVAFLHGRFSDALSACAEAEPVFRSQCTGVWWETCNARTMIAWAMAHRGDTIELDARIHAWEVEARERGDHFMLTNLLAFPLPYQRLIADDVAGAESILREALERWPYSGFHIQHVSVLFSRALVMLYQGDGVRAYTEVNRKWPIMVRSLQTRNQVTRVMLRDVRARGALAAAAAGIDRTTSLARAARDARLIEREGGGWITGYVARLRAGLAAVRGDAAAAERELRSAHAALDASGLVLQAAVARRQLGLLIGGDEGRQLVVDSASLLRDRDVADVDAITRMLGVALS